MGIREKAISIGERIAWPDAVTRAAIGQLVARTERELALAPENADRLFARAMTQFPIALNTADANTQHYELPADFFELFLGPRLKYSCCLFDGDATTLAAAETRALDAASDYSALADGQTILELGCGWGSLSLHMAARFPSARILSVSNSRTQRKFILKQAAERGIRNLDVVTSDMNDFTTALRFDRVVSIEMFEHMANWRSLLTRIHAWLKPDGRLYIHVFAHRRVPYRFDREDKTDWIARHFFTGGIMPSHDLIRQFQDCFNLEQHWRWSGEHYRRTAEAWLANFDQAGDEIDATLRRVYGADATLWKRRWRLFLLATMGLFGHAGGAPWGISHYRLAPAAR